MKKALSKTLVGVALFLGAWLATEALELPPLDGTDQPEWTAISVVHVRQLGGKLPAGVGRDQREGDLHPEPWRQGVQATTFGWPNPSLHKLVWGLACDPLTPEKVFPGVFLRYHRGDRARMAQAVQPLVPAIERAQALVALFSAACAVLLFLLVRALAGWIGGLAAASLWLVHPVVRTWSHQARPDFGMLALFLLVPLMVVVLAPQLAGERGRARQVLAWMLAGLLAGLCAATKLNGALIGVFLVLSVPLFALLRNSEGERPRLLPLLCSSLTGALVAALTLFSLFPYLWSAPLEHLNEVLEFWSEHMAYQQERWEAAGGTATRTLGEKSTLVASRLLGRDEPLQALTGIPGGVALLVAGLTVLALQSLGHGRFAGNVKGRAAAQVVCLWVLVTLAGTTLWLPLEWDRYFFPIIAIVVLAEGVVVGLLADRFLPESSRLAGR
jgi:hypothetical protein